MIKQKKKKNENKRKIILFIIQNRFRTRLKNFFLHPHNDIIFFFFFHEYLNENRWTIEIDIVRGLPYSERWGNEKGNGKFAVHIYIFSRNINTRTYIYIF